MKNLTLIALFATLIIFQCCESDSDEDNSILEANFSAAERNVAIGEQVLFKDESIGEPSTWLWEFPGGSPATSTEQNPSVTYSEEGFKSVTLTVSNVAETDMVEKLDYIDVDSDPIVAEEFAAEFEVDTYEVEIGEEVEFRDVTVGATSRQWEFQGGDPETSTEQNPIVTFSTTGTKTVKLTVSDGTNSSSIEDSIEVIIPQLTESEIIEKYDQALIDLKQFIQYTYLFDAVLTNQYELSGDWSDIYNHSYSPNSVKVEKLWNDSFQMLDDIALMYLNLSNISDQNLLYLYESRLKVVDAYVRHILLNYFGYIPFYGPGKTDELSWRVAVVATIEDTELITYDITEEVNSLNNLPAFDNGYNVEYGSDVTFTDAFLKAFRMRFGLTSISGEMYRQPFEIETDFEDIALNHVYIESPYDKIFDNGWRLESILGFVADGDAEFSSFFNIGDYVPVIRATEPTLIYLETYLRQRNPDEIIGDEADEINDFEAIYNELATKHGYEGLPLPSITSEEILDLLFEVWIEDFRYEGRAFQVMKRFDKAKTILGIEDYQHLLPIPQFAIDANVNIAQNQGY